jgi:hypothetical protein
MKKAKPTIDSLLSAPWGVGLRYAGIASLEDLPRLGRSNVERMRQFWVDRPVGGTSEKCDYLASLIRGGLADKPILPCLRGDFSEGEDVVVHESTGRWLEGTTGQSAARWIVPVVGRCWLPEEDPVGADDPLRMMYPHSPRLMRPGDLQFLLHSPAFAAMWCRSSTWTGCSPEEFLADLTIYRTGGVMIEETANGEPIWEWG